MLSKKTLSLTLLLLGLALPVIAYVGGQIYNADVASYGGPPNQGAMVMAFFVLAISVVVGSCMVLTSLIVTLIPIRQTTARSSSSR